MPMATNYQATLKRAYRLWKAYKTATLEYCRLAQSLGIGTADLNRKCWRINYYKRQQQRKVG